MWNDKDNEESLTSEWLWDISKLMLMLSIQVGSFTLETKNIFLQLERILGTRNFAQFEWSLKQNDCIRLYDIE
jgi:hypothetical protein